MIAKLNADNHGKAYVAIGGKKGSLKAMGVIKDAFSGTEVPPNPELKMALGGARGGANQPAPVPARPRTAYPSLFTHR
jgi:hypothetical protein